MITGLWNSLPEEVVTAVSLDSFKKGLEKFMENKGIIMDALGQPAG